jgi:hypothetical protein
VPDVKYLHDLSVNGEQDHVAVTDHPAAAGTAQQLRAAFP